MTSPETLNRPSASETLTLTRETVSVDLGHALGETDPANLALAEAGVQAKALIAIEAGRQRFVIADVSQAPTVVGSGPDVAIYQPLQKEDRVGKQSPTLYRLPTSAPYVLFHFDTDDLVTGRAVLPEMPIVVGRSAVRTDSKSDRFEYDEDLSFAPYHLLIQPDETARSVQISGLDADFPTEVRRAIEAERTRRTVTPPLNNLILDAVTAAIPGKEQLVRRGGPDYENASKLHPYELWRQRGNDGQTSNLRYIEHYVTVRKQLALLFKDGYLYTNTSDFIDAISDVHRYLGQAGVYNEVNKGTILEEHDLGEIRTGKDRPTNRRIDESLKVAVIAKKYGDPYGSNERLEKGEPFKKSTSQVILPGITESNLPGDIVTYGKDGNRDRYQYFYPSGDSLNEYFAQITKLGQAIETEIKAPREIDVTGVLETIGRQYQYGACARPFNHVNNSIFMELANTQVKILGFKGITHGLMDLAAQRMQPENFAHYFVARVLGQEP